MTEDILIRVAGAVLSGIVLLVLGRWASKLNRTLDDQLVINAKTAGALDLIVEKLNGHERMDEVRFDHLSDRLGILERDVAHRSGRA